MGKKDTAAKIYMSDNEKFADAFNYIIYGGQQVIRSERLDEQDTAELMGVLIDDKKLYTKQNYRDILKKCVIKYDESTTYALLGIENQSELHYAMPVRNMLYDALNYAMQVKEKSKEHSENKDLKKSSEFLSGFKANNKIKPIVTLVIYFNSGEWDAPRSLSDMFDYADDNIMRLVSDYKINLIVPEEIQDSEKFKTDLRYVIDFIKASNDKDELKKMINRNHDMYSKMEEDTAMLLNECANMRIKAGKDKVVDMCKAIEDMMEDARKEERVKNRKEITNLCDEREKAILNMLNKLTPEDIIGFGYDRDVVMKLAEK